MFVGTQKALLPVHPAAQPSQLPVQAQLQVQASVLTWSPSGPASHDPQTLHRGEPRLQQCPQAELSAGEPSVRTRALCGSGRHPRTETQPTCWSSRHVFSPDPGPGCATLGWSLTLAARVAQCGREVSIVCPHGPRGSQGPHCVSCVAETQTDPKLFPLSLSSVDDSGNAIIGCLVSGFFPSQPVSVTWSHTGQGTSVTNFPAVQTTSGGLYSMTSQLTLPASQCPAEENKKCQVQHLSSSKSVDVPCQESILPSRCQPKLSLHRPAIEDLLLGSNANLTCTLSGLDDAQGATFTWESSGEKEAIQGTPQRDASGCYSVSSVLPGCAEPWNRGENFSCTVTYPGSKSPLTATIAKTLGNTLRPQVHLLPPPSEELALNELVTLTCVVRGFSPEEVLLRWLHGNQELSREKYLVWGPLPEASQGAATFAVTSMLRVEAESWKSGDSYSCMVGHEALPMAFTQKTIDRLAGKPTHVNVSVVLSEVDGVCY
ncbi:Ig alpha-1 chain C region [Pteropus alecto]|uniref:Ig alpha-1 chain C region n=1 Tax=Pteropus alecto TaxID=9402 RepID=L5JPI9_PTEAL|nr:Ig alpha-1 chain C region [Pteropus alecto]